MNADTLAFRPADAMGDLWMELSSDAAQDPAPVRPLALVTRKPSLDDSEATDAL